MLNVSNIYVTILFIMQYLSLKNKNNIFSAKGSAFMIIFV